MRLRAHLLLIALCAILVYSNTLDVPFVFDDQVYITDNPLVRDSTYLLLPSTTRSLAISDQVKNSVMTRYLGYASFRMNYLISGRGVASYHAFNMAVHVASAIMVCLLVLWLASAAGVDGAGGGHVALWTALLFAVHPVNTQAVTYLSQRFASMSALFYIGSVALYVRHRLTDRPGNLIASILLALAAVHTKEIAFTIPVSIVLVELIFFTDTLRSRLLRLMPYIAAVLLIPYYVLSFGAGHYEGALSGGSGSLGRAGYLITSIRVMATYMRLLVWPASQQVDYYYPSYDSFLNIAVASSAVLIAALIAWAVRKLRMPRDKAGLRLLAGFGVLWFFVNVALENSVIVLDNVIFEHRLYLPAVGLFMSAVCVAYGYADRVNQRKAAAIAGTVIIIALGATAYVRNSLWLEPARLWADNIAKSPGNDKAYSNMATALGSSGDIANATSMITGAARGSSNWIGHYEAGRMLMQQGRVVESIEYFNAAMKLNPGSAHVHSMLAAAYLREGQADRGLVHLNLALHLDNTLPSVSYNLGAYYMDSADPVRAEFYLRNAIRLDEGYGLAHAKLGKLYLQQARYADAERHLRAALDCDTLAPGTGYNLAMAIYMQGRPDEAEAVLSSDWLGERGAQEYVLMALISFDRADVQGAMVRLAKALEADPSNEAALRMLSMIKSGERR